MAEGCKTPRVCVAAIAGAFGVRGEVRLKTFTEDPMAIASYGPLSDEAGRHSFAVKGPRTAKGGLVARLAGVNSREEAEALKGTRLYVPRDRLPDPGEEEYYHADLIGLAVRDLDGKTLGHVKAVFDFGAGDLLEVHVSGAPRTQLIPFSQAGVPVVDLRGGFLVVDLSAVEDGPDEASGAPPANAPPEKAPP
ncbi:MAG: ribosome maturation factor RimM, partial [Pseudomonadota bacterium]